MDLTVHDIRTLNFGSVEGSDVREKTSSFGLFADSNQASDISTQQQDSSLGLQFSLKALQGSYSQPGPTDSARQSPVGFSPRASASFFAKTFGSSDDLRLMSSNSLLQGVGEQQRQDSWYNLESIDSPSINRLHPELERDGEQMIAPPRREHSLADTTAPPVAGNRKWSIVDDDIFSSVGGLELGHEGESEGGIMPGLASGPPAPVMAGLEDHQLAEQPSRTLFVRASCVPDLSDAEITNLFQAYGDIRHLYTACKHRGFFTVSYFDLRSALQAAKQLQGSLLHGCQLDIHFSLPKAQAGDGGINQLLLQGTVLVFNLDPDTTNEQLVWIFSNFGEVKEIRENSDRSSQKFIEFYDIRHASAALRAMNKAELAGKQPTGPAPSLQQLAALSPSGAQAGGSFPSPQGGADGPGERSQHRPVPRPASLHQLMPVSEQVPSGPVSQSWDPSVSAMDSMYQLLQNQRQQQGQPGGSANQQMFGQGGMMPGSNNQLSLQAIGQYLQQLPQQQANELAATLMQEGHLPAGGSLAAMKMAGRGGSAGSLLTLGNQAVMHPSVPRGMHVSDSASSIASSVAANLNGGAGGPNGSMYLPGMNPGATYGTSPVMGGRPELSHPEAMYHHHQNAGQPGGNYGHMQGGDMAAAALAGLSLGASPDAAAQFMWNTQMAAATAAANQQSSANAQWMGNVYQQNPNAALQAAAANLGLTGAMNLADLQARQQQLAMGLAALGVPGINPQALNAASMAANLQGLQGLNAAQLLHQAGALGGFAHRAPSLSGAAQLLQHAGLGMPALHSLGIAHGGPGLGIKSASTNSLQSAADRQRDAARGGGRLSRRNADPAAELERKSQQDKMFALEPDKIRAGEDRRTTLMIKNIPNKYTQKMLLATVDESLRGSYDFFYLPIDFKNKCNVGYAFINMTMPINIIPLIERFNGKKWERFNSEKVCHISYARIQGKAALVAHFQNSSLMHEDKRCRPVLFHSEGPEIGEPEPFPVGNNVRARITHGFKDREGLPGTSRDMQPYKGRDGMMLK